MKPEKDLCDVLESSPVAQADVCTGDPGVPTELQDRRSAVSKKCSRSREKARLM